MLSVLALRLVRGAVLAIAEFPLSEARRAQEMVLRDEARGKVVLVCGGA